MNIDAALQRASFALSPSTATRGYSIESLNARLALDALRRELPEPHELVRMADSLTGEGSVIYKRKLLRLAAVLKEPIPGLS